MTSRPGPLAYAAVAITVLCWAAAFPMTAIALQAIDPAPLAALRYGIAGLTALAWLVVARPKIPSSRDALAFIVCGTVGVAFYTLLLNAGQQTVPPGAASFITNTVPILTALLAWLTTGERLGPVAWTGTGIAFGGIVLIASEQPGGLALGAGSSLLLSAACCWAVYFVLQRALVRRYGALNATAFTLAAGAGLLSVWLPEGWRQAAVTIPEGAFASWVVYAVLALGLASTVLAFTTWTHALDRFGAARAANFLYLVPPTTVVLSFVLTGDLPSLRTLVGGALAIIGVALVNGPRRASSERASQER